MNLVQYATVPLTGNCLTTSAGFCPLSNPGAPLALGEEDDMEDEEFDDEARPHTPDVSEEEELGQADELADDEE